MLRRHFVGGGLAALGLAACQPQANVRPEATPAALPAKPKLALALGGGAARGFAHIGVIKVLEGSGIQPDIVIGTSAGSVVAPSTRRATIPLSCRS